MDLLLRIGALAERTGLSTHVLRVWEERYQLLTPQRSASGYRLYSAEDEERVRQMMELRAQGVAAAEAAQRVLNAALARSEPAVLDDLLDDLIGAFTIYDEAAVHAIIDTAVVGHPLARVIDSLFFPFLRRLGEAWVLGRVTVAQEHYASTLVRGRMMGMALEASRSAPARSGPGQRAVLACTPFERHDIGLLALNLLLRSDGWQVAFLGADTPVQDAARLCRDVGADVLVLTGTEPHMYAAQLEQYAAELASLPATTTLVVGGTAATQEVADRHGAVLLSLDPERAVETLAELQAATPVPT
jgi:methanogenic corrinoid protein MtbC1